MFILLTYDIDFSDENCRKRLNKVAKICEANGIRVQNSTFELTIDYSEFIKLKDKLNKIISSEDSIRFYILGNNYKNKIETLGKKEYIELSEDSCFIL